MFVFLITPPLRRAPIPLDFTSPIISAAQAALTSLHAFYATSGHKPSDFQWSAIEDLLDHLEKAAAGSLAPAVYLSALPAGTGKSTSIQAFAGALCNSTHYDSVGMLIACNRVSEVEDMATALQEHRRNLCVIVGKANPLVLAMGDHAEANEAKIVLTTQASLKASLQNGQEFSEARRYYFRGQRRSVVCWDEALTFNHPVVIDGDTIGGLAKLMRAQSGDAATALQRWVATMAEAPKEPAAFPVPDFEALGVDFRQLEEAAEGNDLTQVKALRALSGGTGWLIPGTFHSSSLVTHIREIPPSIMPVIVTDASAAPGVHPFAYEQIGTTLPVIYLKSAPKTYGNLTIRLVPTAASRSTYQDRKSTKGRDLIDLAVRYAEQWPQEEDVLMVSYGNPMVIKGVEERTVRDAISVRLAPGRAGRVRHLTWGRHTATNAYKDVRKLVLTGLNFLPPTASYAASAAALNKSLKTDADQPAPLLVSQMRLGMLRDATLQAILRGNARKSKGGDCGEMEVVIFQTPQTGLSVEDYREMFPAACIVSDHSMLPQSALKGKILALSIIVIRNITSGMTEMTNGSLWEELGMTPRNYRKLTTGNPAWQHWLTLQGLSKATLAGRKEGLRLFG